MPHGKEEPIMWKKIAAVALPAAWRWWRKRRDRRHDGRD